MSTPDPPKDIAPAMNSLGNTPEIGKTRSEPYTTFSPRGRLFVVLIIGFAAITSPLTAQVYLPLLPVLEGQFSASSQEIDMTLTIYIIFQGISPAVFGPLSDTVGRRPVYLFTIGIYALANLGMALNKHNYAVLLVLRAFQSLGASAAYAISYGIVADVCVPSERGRMMGWVSMALNLGTCLGPIMGGVVVYLSGQIEWIFWALFIVGILLFLIVGMFLPETARKLVGNGSNPNKMPFWQESWWNDMKSIQAKGKKEKTGTLRAEAPQSFSAWRKDILAQLNIRMFILPFRVIFYPDAFLCLWIHGSFYAVDYILAATVSDLFTNVYHFNTLLVGISYLPRGVGIITGGYCNGRIIDYNYKVTARKHNRPINRASGDDLRDFPIELARSRGTYYLLAISTATLVAYGWTVYYEKHFAIPLVLQFIQGFWGTCYYNTYNTLLVDVFPKSPSSAAATASIVRCAMAAIGVSIMQPMLDAAGLGWYFTALGLWSAGFGAVAVWGLRRFGMRWRQRRDGGE